jgi:hypothetical protein
VKGELGHGCMHNRGLFLLSGVALSRFDPRFRYIDVLAHFWAALFVPLAPSLMRRPQRRQKGPL